ncbi:hypothetical protein [Octadecabacter ascidiaceicola]|uniref:Uncharacterized protein n=1 Tax=Octadecabacter ascidiaceicola TaxID=1655543 RepID=A0A238KRZ3_9RHOB|nr:hypothetical protein [Octadecabacter ascidiaceicola]SMX45599.1 hypothetical protein OCA8868_03335 [Octadecabacter ascidiaceicola]
MIDDLGRRLSHQASQQREKDRQADARLDRQQQHREWLENSRVLNRAREQQRKDDTRAVELEQKRQDSLAGQAEKAAISRDEQEEITHREQSLQLIGAHIYRQNLEADFDHLVNVKNVEVQEHDLITGIDTRNRLTTDNNTARNQRREIREHTKAYIRERLTDFYLAEAAKVTAQQNQERTIKAESAARIREKWTDNDIRKDFELFMAELAQKTKAWQTSDIEGVLRKLNEA